MKAANDPSVRTVYLIRHGRTAHNVSDRLRGRSDLALDATGRAQAQALGDLFAGVALSRVLTSPLRRAMQTAEPVARAAGVRVEPIAGFNDRDYGEWTGAERSMVIQRFGSVDSAPGVEAWDVLSARVRQSFETVVAESARPAIAIVGHDASNKALLAAIAPESTERLDEIAQDNGCWNRLDRRGRGWRLSVFNAEPGDGQRP